MTLIVGLRQWLELTSIYQIADQPPAVVSTLALCRWARLVPRLSIPTSRKPYAMLAWYCP